MIPKFNQTYFQTLFYCFTVCICRENYKHKDFSLLHPMVWSHKFRCLIASYMCRFYRDSTLNISRIVIINEALYQNSGVFVYFMTMLHHKHLSLWSKFSGKVVTIPPLSSPMVLLTFLVMMTRPNKPVSAISQCLSGPP